MSVTQEDNWPKGVQPFVVKRTGPKTAVLVSEFHAFGRVIKPGYVTDGNSTPRLFYGILARFTSGYPAGIIHDERYDPQPNEHGLKVRVISRKQADQEFRVNLKRLGINLFRRNSAYYAVRSAGWSAWNRGSKNPQIIDQWRITDAG